MSTATSSRYPTPLYEGAAQAALDELSVTLRVRIEEIAREGTAKDRRFWLRIGGRYIIIRCAMVRHPRQLCQAFARSPRRAAWDPIPEVWLNRRQARRVLALMHQVADADPRSSRSAVPASVRRGGGAS